MKDDECIGCEGRLLEIRDGGAGGIFMIRRDHFEPSITGVLAAWSRDRSEGESSLS